MYSGHGISPARTASVYSSNYGWLMNEAEMQSPRPRALASLRLHLRTGKDGVIGCEKGISSWLLAIRRDQRAFDYCANHRRSLPPGETRVPWSECVRVSLCLELCPKLCLGVRWGGRRRGEARLPIPSQRRPSHVHCLRWSCAHPSSQDELQGTSPSPHAFHGGK